MAKSIWTILFIAAWIAVPLQATAPRYVIGGTVAEATVKDGATGLEWQQGRSYSGALSWKDALAFCEGLEYGGYSDWRLPDVRELFTIVDEKKETAPAINTVYFVNFYSHGYWTSTTVRTVPNSAHMIYFNDYDVRVGRGGIDFLTKSSDGQALCVRKM